MWSPVSKQRSFLIFLLFASLILITILISYSSSNTRSNEKLSKIDVYRFPITATASTTTKATSQTDIRLPRISCLILTSPSNFETRAKAINGTWGPRCDRYFFVSESYNRTLPPEQEQIAQRLPIAPIVNITAGYDHLTQKSSLAFLFAYQKLLNDSEWFIKSDDDTYLIVENLKAFLSEQNPEEPVTFGYNFKVIVPRGYHSGGASYVLSREALRRFHTAMNDPASPCQKDTGAEDVEIAKCLRSQGVYPGKSLDKDNRELFHPLPFTHHFGGNFPDWLYSYAENPLQKGYGCCSDHSISFHYVSPEEQYFMDYLLYRARSPSPYTAGWFKNFDRSTESRTKSVR